MKTEKQINNIIIKIKNYGKGTLRSESKIFWLEEMIKAIRINDAEDYNNCYKEYEKRRDYPPKEW